MRKISILWLYFWYSHYFCASKRQFCDKYINFGKKYCRLIVARATIEKERQRELNEMLKKIVSVLCCAIVLVNMCCCGNNKKITLNKLGVSASGESVSHIEFDENANCEIMEKVNVYSVEGKKFCENDIERIAKELETQIKKKEKVDNNIIEYELNNGGYLAYYDNSGSITYIGNGDNDDVIVGTKFDEEKCIKNAEKFIKETQMLDYEKLELKSVDVGESVEVEDEIVPITYEVQYILKSPEPIEFYGVGPGIIIEFDAQYNICSFVASCKNVEKKVAEYETLTEEEIVEKICEGDNVLIDGCSEDECANVKIDTVELMLYSDSIYVNQEYMVPYYVLEGVDEYNNEITIVSPSIDEKYIEYK